MMMLAVALLLIICALAWIHYKNAFSYWKRHNVPYVKPMFPFGNLANPIVRKQAIYLDIVDVYNILKARGFKHGGIYMSTSPVYMPIHADFLRNIMAKDFHHFVNHGGHVNEKDDPLSAHLFSLENDRWKNLRAKLTPTFSSGKMKMMFQTMKNCVGPLLEEIDKLRGNNEALDIKELVARFTTDVIGSCAFGIDCNSFKDPDAEFRKYGKLSFEIDFISKLRMFVHLTFPKLAHIIRMRHTRREVSDFFLTMVKNTVKYREEHNISRPDFMQLLINLKNSPDGLTLNEISAQAFIFFLAGFETSSTTMTFSFYELAKNQDIQNKLRIEINSVLAKHNDEVTYDAIQEMKYLGQVIDETLRKYPPLPLLRRVCNKSYNVSETNVVIEKGTSVFIPSYAIHHDPEYYPNPEIFDPDRFSDENKQNQVPYTFLPFGEGPRICIGLRFGLMQMKIGIVEILRHHRITLNARTPTHMNLNPNTFVLAFKNTLYLDSKKIL